MKANIGSRDQSTRIFVGLLLGAFCLVGIVYGTAALILAAVAGLLIVTGMLRWCPLYAVFGFSSVEDPASSR